MDTRPISVTGTGAASRSAAWSRDLVSALLALWIVSAVYADGWAHLNAPGLESFFTPWHGALYAGLAAFAGWIAVVAWRAPRSGGSRIGALPPGYRGAVLGAVVFAAGGTADMVWHEVFGIEAAIDALVSPSHLVLLIGGMLLVTTAWRAQRAASPVATLPEWLSIVAAAALAAFFVSYASAFTFQGPTSPMTRIPEGAEGHFEAELPIMVGLAGYLIATVVTTVPLLLAIGAVRRPRYAVTSLVGIVAGLNVAMMDFDATLLAAAFGALGGAIAADALLTRLRPEVRADRYAVPVTAGTVAVLVWTGNLLGYALAGVVRWPVELWLGAPVLCGLAATVLGMLLTPKPSQRLQV